MKIYAIAFCISMLFLTACSANRYSANSVIKLPSYCTTSRAMPVTADPNVLSYDIVNCSSQDYNVLGSITIYKDIAPLETQRTFNTQQFDKYANVSEGSLLQGNENGTIYKVRGLHMKCASEYWVTESNITYTTNYLGNPRLLQWQKDMISNNKSEFYSVLVVIDSNMVLGLVDSYVDTTRRNHDIEDYIKDTSLLCN